MLLDFRLNACSYLACGIYTGPLVHCREVVSLKDGGYLNRPYNSVAVL